MDNERRTEAINTCLDYFIENGLTKTSTRGLSNALNLQNAGLYYYFESKDEVVLLCAEEAAMRLEHNLLDWALEELNSTDTLVECLVSKAKELAPTMRFFVSVCASCYYKDAMKPILDKLANRYPLHAAKFAEKIGCDVDDIAPYIYAGISAITTYMTFREYIYTGPQLEMVKTQIERLMSKRDH